MNVTSESIVEKTRSKVVVDPNVKISILHEFMHKT